MEEALCKFKLLGGFVLLFVGRSGVTVDIEEPRDAVLVTNGDSEIGQVSFYLHVFFFLLLQNCHCTRIIRVIL